MQPGEARGKGQQPTWRLPEVEFSSLWKEGTTPDHLCHPREPAGVPTRENEPALSFWGLREVTATCDRPNGPGQGTGSSGLRRRAGSKSDRDREAAGQRAVHPQPSVRGGVEDWAPSSRPCTLRATGTDREPRLSVPWG